MKHTTSPSRALRLTKHMTIANIVCGGLFAVTVVLLLQMTPETQAITTEAIGVRIMTNPRNLSARDWYRDQCNQGTFTDCGTPAPVTVGGYSGVRDGDTAYVNAANATPGALFTNIYIFSLSQGASAKGKDVFAALLDDAEFNESAAFPPAKKPALQRDTIRKADLGRINDAILAYYNQKRCSISQNILCTTNEDCPGTRASAAGATPSGEFCDEWVPPIASGSFIRGVTFSNWPSWQATLGATLGMTLPVDPGSTLVSDPARQGFIGCGGRFDRTTCWDAQALQMQCPQPSGRFVYAYRAIKSNPTVAAPDTYNLTTTFEYDGAPNWQTLDMQRLINGGSGAPSICVIQ